MTDLFNQFDIDQVTQTCQQRGKPYGISFGTMDKLSNTHLSLEAAEYARDQGRYDEFHHNTFKAYFSDGKDIGNMEVLLEVAKESGLDADELQAALTDKRYAERVSNGSKSAKESGVTAIPAFFIEGGDSITGAVSEDRFREALQSIAES